MNKQLLAFRLLYISFAPLKLLSHRSIHRVGKILGSLTYYLHTNFRKKSLSNLSLAKDLDLSEKELKKIAKKSFQSLVTTCLEYPKFAEEPDISKSITCVNPELADAFIRKKQGIVFFCGHQSNWEVLFLDGTRRMPGVAIGRPIKNLYIYEWIQSIRERFGGNMISPQNAIKEGFKALKRGLFLGIVGDQGMPESGFSCKFLGRLAWTSPSPALLAYKAKCPIMVATTKRIKGKYYITYSDPIWPNFENTIDTEMPILMTKTLEIFEKSILENPGEWLWQHNRWKQETPRNVYYKYRYDCMLIIMPDDRLEFTKLKDEIKIFKEIYPLAFISLMIPKAFEKDLNLEGVETLYYQSHQDLFKRDYRFKIVYNFSRYIKIKKHFLSLSAMKVVDLNDLRKDASEHLSEKIDYSFSDIVKRAICRPGTLWEKTNATQ
ncbi:MAG: Lipid A biosynthesis lauroyltransferase [Chlamydiia bacterium]|nr:Lipid A biosynthesis lauroyltransferase [Chlamydiia bacterium]